MNTLSDHIKALPKKTMAAWAADLGISRPYLYGLLDGTRSPSPDVARQISDATGGNVPVTAWPRLAPLFGATVQKDSAA